MLRRLLTEVINDIPDTRSALSRFYRLLQVWISKNRIDLTLAATISVVVGTAYWFIANQIPPVLIDPERDAWVWFEADLIRVQQIMVDRRADNYRTNVHPLQAIVMYPPTKMLVLLGIPERLAAISILAATAGAWSATLFGGFRGLGLRRPDAIAFTVLGAVSGAAIFWMPVPEVYAFGALSVTIALALGTLMQRGTVPPILQAISSVISFSVTTTNWMAGILTVLASNTYKRAFRILVDGFAIATALFAIQKVIFPRSTFFVPRIGLEMSFVFHEYGGGTLDKIRAFFAYSVVVPEVPFLDHPTFPEWVRLSIQLVPLNALTGIGMVGLVLWSVVFVAGLTNAVTKPDQNRPIAQALTLYLLFQFLLHLVYGDETFLYSLNYLPAMLLLAGFSVLGRGRLIFLSLVIISIPLLAYNNLSEYLRVTSYLQAHADMLLHH